MTKEETEERFKSIVNAYDHLMLSKFDQDADDEDNVHVNKNDIWAGQLYGRLFRLTSERHDKILHMWEQLSWWDSSHNTCRNVLIVSSIEPISLLYLEWQYHYIVSYMQILSQ